MLSYKLIIKEINPCIQKWFLAFILCVFISNFLVAQEGLPANSKAGKCYLRCIVDDTWREKKVLVTKIPGYTKMEVASGEYKLVEEKITIHPGYNKPATIPQYLKK